MLEFMNFDTVANVCTDPWRRGILADEIAALVPGALVTTAGLRRAFNLADERAVKAMIERGELPAPAQLRTGHVWTAGALVRHWEHMLDAAAKDAGGAKRMLQQHSA